MAFSFRHPFVATTATLSAPAPNRKIPIYDPKGLMDRINRTLRHRLSDRVEDLFQAACLAGDLDAADDLLTVLVKMHERRSARFGGDRRIGNDTIAQARAELARRRTAASFRHAA